MTSPTPGATIHGYPRQGRDRQLKKAIEAYWKGRIDRTTLQDRVREVRLARLRTMIDAGLTEIPVGDFSCYDHVLDTAVLVGAVPPRHRSAAPGPDRYFAMARGNDEVEPLEMTKWFDSNYHYLVPELAADTEFTLDATSLLEQVDEARTFGTPVRAVLVGPVTFLALAKSVDPDPRFDVWSLLDPLLAIYSELLPRLVDHGVEWVQFDESIAVGDLDANIVSALERSYQRLAATPERPAIVIASSYGHLDEAATTFADAPVEGLAVDLSAAGERNLTTLAGSPGLRSKRLIAGVVDARNVWRTDLDRALGLARTAQAWVSSLDIASSASLLHVPHDVSRETELDPRLTAQLAFADQKIAEVTTIARGLADGDDAIADELAADRRRRTARTAEDWLTDPRVRDRAASVSDAELRRPKPYPERITAQQRKLQLPALPTTTIGSFPQTAELRRDRAALRKGTLSPEQYGAAMRAEIDRVITLQTEIGLDVLVHGEPERNDMVQYFADQLTGVFATQHGWVQSYGTRCVRPPLIAGDITRRGPMTVEWSSYAQSRTSLPVKGMLTGPVTMLAWSFVRDDQPRSETGRQLALALRDEVADLEAAGIGIIQVDEPALRETLPLRSVDRPDYLRWAVDAFRLSTAGAAAETQIHTHMCYAEFGDIIDAIDAMDADVISLEATRSRMAVVDELTEHAYSRQVGPGVWDIHSPRVPSTAEVTELLGTAVAGLGREQVWVNPDCGLKTRGYPEAVPALRALVAAARALRDWPPRARIRRWPTQQLQWLRGPTTYA